LDSGIAQKIYKELKNRGYNTFFSKISLEDKLGSEYEPYIFSALLAAKVMIVVGSSAENINSKWVKNEWHRFLARIEKDRQKRLIACYIDMNVYDLPSEFAALQAQDMRKVSALDDLATSIDKIFGRNAEAHKKIDVSEVIGAFSNQNSELQQFIENGHVYLEQENFGSATREFNRALSIKANSADAYLGMVLADVRCRDINEFRRLFDSRYMGFLYESTAFKRFIQYSSGAQKRDIVQLLIDNEKRDLVKHEKLLTSIADNVSRIHLKLADYTPNEITTESEKYRSQDVSDRSAANFSEIIGSDSLYIDQLIVGLEQNNEEIRHDVFGGEA
jgi:hypothetical protein